LKESFWNELEKDAEESKLDLYEYRLCQIVHENINESFCSPRNKSCA
jgi:hypothetical protein